MENLPIPSAYLQQPLLNKDPHLNKIFPTLPFLSYYQPPNLKLLFTSASLSNEIFITSTFSCKSPKCPFLSKHNNQFNNWSQWSLYKISRNYNCDLFNAIYAISCNLCPKAIYIKETSNST